MNHDELVKTVRELVGLPKRDIDLILKVAGDVCAEALVQGRRVSLAGLGKIEVARRAARSGRNPITGERMRIPARRIVRLNASGALKQKLAE